VEFTNGEEGENHEWRSDWYQRNGFKNYGVNQN